MVIVETKINTSSIPNAGLGLFVIAKIAAGEAITKANPDSFLQFSQEEFDSCTVGVKDFVRTYGTLDGVTWRLDKGREKFINHSRNPNIDAGGLARRDIAAGEELTHDYRQIDDSILQDPPSWL